MNKLNGGLEVLRSFIASSGIPVSRVATDDFCSIWTPLSCKRKEILTGPGETERNLYFVLKGVQRVYYLDETGREATLVFTYPPSFAGVVDSFLLQSPSRYYFETLTASELLQAPWTKLKEVMDRQPDISNLVFKMSTMAMSGLLSRMVELQCFSSEEKFRALLKRSPVVLQHVPHKYLANYLGIDPTNFSKFINTIKT